MKGKTLKECIERSSFTVKKVAELFGISRQRLYDLYKEDEIGMEYSRLAEEIGLTKLDTTQKNDGAKYLSADTLYNLWQDERRERMELTQTVIHLANQIDVLNNKNAPSNKKQKIAS